MKRLYSFLAGILAIILVLWEFLTILTVKSIVAIVKNWLSTTGRLYTSDFLEKFTEETGIQVQYETFDSNEAMYTKIKQGGTTYDIAIE